MNEDMGVRVQLLTEREGFWFGLLARIGSCASALSCEWKGGEEVRSMACSYSKRETRMSLI